jgi:competence protein ComGC
MNKKFKNMQSFAMVPVLVIAGIVAVHMMMAIAYIAPAMPMA